MQEGLPLEHGTKLLGDAREEALDGGVVRNKRDGAIKTSRSNITPEGLTPSICKTIQRMSYKLVLMLFGIQEANDSDCLFCTLAIWKSTS